MLEGRKFEHIVATTEELLEEVNEELVKQTKEEHILKVPFSKKYLLPIWNAITIIIEYVVSSLVSLLILFCMPGGVQHDVIEVSKQHPLVLTYFILRSLAIYSFMFALGAVIYSLYLMWTLVLFEKGLFFLYVFMISLAVCDILMIIMSVLWKLVSNSVEGILRGRRMYTSS